MFEVQSYGSYDPNHADPKDDRYPNILSILPVKPTNATLVPNNAPSSGRKPKESQGTTER